MAQAKNGDTVTVHYTGRLDNGTVFDTSVNSKPLEFTIGKSGIIPGFQQSVVGMKPGESKTTKIPADLAYGKHRKELVMIIDRGKFPTDLKLEVGRQLEIRQTNGQTKIAKVLNVKESSVTLDLNHPLAGENLTFDIQLIEIL